MTFPASGLFVPTFVGGLGGTLVVNLDLETHRVALWTDTGTYDLTADTAYGVAPWNANEAAGTGYTAGGLLLTGTSWAHTATGVIRFDATLDPSWATSTIPNVRGCLIYADALAGNNGLCAINFGALYSSSAGTFSITWDTAGIFTWDVIP